MSLFKNTLLFLFYVHESAACMYVSIPVLYNTLVSFRHLLSQLSQCPVLDPQKVPKGLHLCLKLEIALNSKNRSDKYFYGKGPKLSMSNRETEKLVSLGQNSLSQEGSSLGW